MPILLDRWGISSPSAFHSPIFDTYVSICFRWSECFCGVRTGSRRTDLEVGRDPPTLLPPAPLESRSASTGGGGQGWPVGHRRSRRDSALDARCRYWTMWARGEGTVRGLSRPPV